MPCRPRFWESAMNHALRRCGRRVWFLLGLTVAITANAAAAETALPRPARSVAPFHPAPSDIPKSDAEAARFLTMATFGPTAADVTLLKQIGYSAWIRAQLKMPVTLQRPYVESLDKAVQNPGQNDRMEVWFFNAVTAPDQLRQRMAWALSQ